MYSVQTPGDYNYNHFWLVPLANERTFTFTVAGCKDVILTLAQTPTNTLSSAYELTLGAESNTKALLKESDGDGGFNLVREAELYHALDCNVGNEFWVTWDGGIIRVGRYNPYQYQFIYWEDPNEQYPKIHGISLANYDDNEALWQFSRDQGECSCLL